MTTPEPRLKGQVAIVTGVGCARARAIALALAAAGAAVAVVETSSRPVAKMAALIEAGGGKAMGFAVGAGDAPTVGRLIAQVEQRLGPIDVLVHRGGPSWETMRQAVLPAMTARGHGRLVDLSAEAMNPERSRLRKALAEDGSSHVSEFAVEIEALNPEDSAQLVLAIVSG